MKISFYFLIVFASECSYFVLFGIKYLLPVNHLSAKFIKWSNTLKQIVGKLPTICLSVFDHFSGLAFKGLRVKIPRDVNNNRP